MAEMKITTFPEIGEIPVSTEPVTTGFASQFTGDIYSNRGRFGGASSYWEISEGKLTAVGAGTGTVFINHGKTAFDNTQTGFILGVENATAKFYIGNSTQYLNWTGTTLNIAGSLTASEIHIPNTTTANSFHVDTDGNSWWGATTLASSAAKVLNTGAGTFSSLTITGGTIQGAVMFVSTVSSTIESEALKDLPSDANQVAYISFDEGLVTSAGKVYDSSPNANDLTLTGGQVNADFVAGVSGTALNFDGTNDYASKSSPSFIDNTEGAVSLWVKFDEVAVQSPILWCVNVDGATDDEFFLQFNSGSTKKLHVGIIVNGSTTLVLGTDANIITDTNWHHIVVTSDGSTIRLYIDGAEKTFTASTGTNSGQWFASATQADIFVLGVIKRATPVAYLDGKFDECRVYSTALTAKQIMALYKNPAGGTTEMHALIMDKLVAGTITSQKITLAVTDGVGDVYIASGKTDFDNTQSGFILGLDDSDSNKAKFYIGNTTTYMNWDATNLTVVGGTITGGTIQTATSGQRIVMTSNTLKGYDASGNETITLLGSGTDYGFITIQPTGASLAGLSILQTGSGHRGILLQDNSSSGDFANEVLFYASRGSVAGHTGNSRLLECFNNVGTGEGFYFENQAVSIGFHLASGSASANPMLQVDFLDTDKTGVFFRNNQSASPVNNGLFEVSQTVTGFNACVFNITNASSTSSVISLIHSNASGFAIVFAGGAQDTTAGGGTQTDRILVKNAAGNTRYLYLYSN